MEDVYYKDEITPVKLSIKDRRIFKELDRNARAPISKIAKKVKMSKEVVNYRIKRLLDLRFITSFNTIIDIQKLGWKSFHVFIRLKNINTKKEKQIVNFFIKHPNVTWIKKCLGNYDIILKILAKDFIELDSILKQVEKKYENSIEKYITDLVAQEASVPFSLLYGEADIQKLNTSSKETINPTQLEFKILKELANNARVPLADLSKKLKTPRDTIKYHIRKLEKNKVIQIYRPSLWPERTGYNYFLLSLKTEKLPEDLEKSFEAYLLNHLNVTYFFKTVGNSDIQVEIRAKTSEKLNEIIKKIRDILKEKLKNHVTLMILNEPKFTYFPNCLLSQDLPS